MYSTCIFCQRPLGANEIVEPFPVGRRLAFDEARGRLWVVCRKCGRWNLTPLDERWEAIETCERLFRDTRIRMSTDNIGLARLREGLELVRIGEPKRPEFAAWRYGDQFGRRRRKAVLGVVGATAIVGGISVVGPVLGTLGPVALSFGWVVAEWLRPRLRVRTDDGRTLTLRLPDLLDAKVESDADGNEWSLLLTHGGNGTEVFRSPDAQRVLGMVLSRINSDGGSRRVVQEAVDRIDGGPAPRHLLGAAWQELRRLDEEYAARGWRVANKLVEYVSSGGLLVGPRQQGAIFRLPRSTRLAVEMLVHEEQERVALEGELAALESAWQEAEEIAAIADNLLVPAPPEQ